MSAENLQKAAVKTRLRLGSEAEALALYSVDQRPKCVAEQAEVFTSEKVPTLVVFAEAYGDAVAVKWLLIQLHDLCMRMGWWDTVTADEQRRLTERLGRVAASVVRSYGWMKLTELMYFLNELEAGKLGQLFMLRNVEKVTDCLKAFVPALHELRSHHYEAETRRKQRAEAEERARLAMLPDEWMISELLAGRKPEMLYNRLLVSEAECERILVEARRRWFRLKGEENPTWEQLHPKQKSTGADGADKND